MSNWVFQQECGFGLFEADGQRYVADFITGQVVPIGPVMWELLETKPADPIAFLWSLCQKYPKCPVEAAVREIERFGERGLFFRISHTPLSRRSLPSRRPKLLVPGDFLSHRRRQTFLTNHTHYCLLKALAEQADIQIPVKPDGEAEEFGFGELGVEPLTVERVGSESTLTWISEEHDGILLLNPRVEQLFCLETDIPVISFWETSCLHKREMMDFAVASVGFAREWDAVCFTAPWIQQWFANNLPQNSHFHTLNHGITLDTSDAPDKQLAQRAVAQFIDNEAFANRPIVGVLSGVQQQQTIPFLLELARECPQLAFLAIDIPLPLASEHVPANLASYPINSLEDYQACTIVLAGLELLCFPTGLGVPSSLIPEALAHGIQLVAIGDVHLPDWLEERIVRIPTQINPWGEPDLPATRVGDILLQLTTQSDGQEISKPNRNHLRTHFSWEQTARDLLQLLDQLWGRREQGHEASHVLPSPLFTLYYDPVRQVTSPASFSLLDMNYQPLQTNLLMSLEQRHHPQEMEQVRDALHTNE